MIHFPLALRYASAKHRHQRRKDLGAEPYINHPIRVVSILVEHGFAWEDLLCAAILHDTLEDTDATRDEILALFPSDPAFGERVCAIVVELTDDKSLPRAERKRLQIEHAPQLTFYAKLIKIADKLDNVHDIVTAVNWPIDRRIAYVDWSGQVVAGCRFHAEGNYTESPRREKLEQSYDLVVADARARLSITT